MLKKGLNLENSIKNESVDPYSPFFLRHTVYAYKVIIQTTYNLPTQFKMNVKESEPEESYVLELKHLFC